MALGPWPLAQGLAGPGWARLSPADGGALPGAGWPGPGWLGPGRLGPGRPRPGSAGPSRLGPGQMGHSWGPTAARTDSAGLGPVVYSGADDLLVVFQWFIPVVYSLLYGVSVDARFFNRIQLFLKFC